jgi:hypothetical protein
MSGILWARKPADPVLVRLWRSLFECFKDDPSEVELVFVEFRPIDDRAVGRAAERLGREGGADRVLDVNEASPVSGFSRNCAQPSQCCGVSAEPPPSAYGPFGRSSLS